MQRLFLWPACAAAALSLAPEAAMAEADDLAEICTGKRLPFESPPFERFDRNADERLTADEVEACAALEAVYSRLDLDGDRVLTRAEFRSFADVWRLRKRALGDDAL